MSKKVSTAFLLFLKGVEQNSSFFVGTKNLAAIKPILVFRLQFPKILSPLGQWNEGNCLILYPDAIQDSYTLGD